MADAMFASDPDTARRMVTEARHTSDSALDDLRAVVRGIHPPVLADRGLVGAVQALAIDLPLPVDVTADLPGRPTAATETAVYFAVAECLANVGKHAGADARLGAAAVRRRPAARRGRRRRPRRRRPATPAPACAG